MDIEPCTFEKELPMTPIVIEHPSIGTVTWQLSDWLEEMIRKVDEVDSRASEEVVADIERRTHRFFLLLMATLKYPPAIPILLPLLDRQLNDFNQVMLVVLDQMSHR